MVHKRVKSKQHLRENRLYGHKEPLFGFSESLSNWEVLFKKMEEKQMMLNIIMGGLIVLFLTYIVLKYGFFII